MKRFLAFVLAFLLALIVPIKASAVTVSAKAAILINGDTGEIIFAQNADERLPMASTTKIMTGLLLCESGNLERTITVTEEMVRVEGSSMGLLPDDKISLHDLLYGLMLASGNDAANTIAIVLAGSVEKFAEMMNNKAAEIGLVNTHFVTPSGLDDDEHYTTAKDLALLTKYALQNEDFAAAVSSKSAALNYGNPPYRRTLTNHNKLLKMVDGCIGVKTGFTKKSGRCLVSAVKRDGKFVIAVTLCAPNDWQDHMNLLEYGISSIKQTVITPKQAEYTLPVISGVKQNIKVNVEPFVINSLETEGFTCEILLPQFVYAPIKKDEILGKAVYKQNGKVVAENDILSTEEITLYISEKSAIKQILDNFLYIASSI